MSGKKKKGKVAVGMSGGVDSSLAAALLVEKGFEVTGVHLECWAEPGCRASQDRKDALAVSVQLGIPFKVLDFKKEYKDKVIEYFYQEYEAGRTPNPDIMCNLEIKFGLFYNWALKHGFDYVATGHYARIREREQNSKFSPNRRAGKIKNFKLLRGIDGVKDPRKEFSTSSVSPSDSENQRGRQTYCLLRSVDEKKDQTYFLYRLREEQLKSILFPVGDLTKKQVRAKAKKRGLHVADKKDSVGVCFIGDINVQEFLKRRLPVRKGEVVMRVGDKDPSTAKTQTASLRAQDDKAGLESLPALSRRYRVTHRDNRYVVVGEHKGVWFYTIGQRVGIKIRIDKALGKKLRLDPTNLPPLYVVSKDVTHNRLIVGFGAETYREKFSVENAHWINGFSKNSKARSQNSEVSVRIRHGGVLIPSKLKEKGKNLQVYLGKPQRGVAPGQAAVFYKGSECLGGGVIAE